ncbi:hypothetical protein QJ043_06795 [Olsenella sp. YH-ols2217]|uniref:MarR family transcriptional regulator n=1 Tax=Kribbibacterium absianum TaxID=3044210 RepID=A0ABT6ZL71_9ACTN|nr:MULTISPECIES: hypothetical protein [unclassified Olsenella]MDJ1121773.1 hypothetical protein [Olsenella sp. YH-ols2216]MDJ1129781.1 hypothetical protein [Olsenella sp. YH-ols2217]
MSHAAGFLVLGAVLAKRLDIASLDEASLKTLGLLDPQGAPTFAGRVCADENDLPGLAVITLDETGQVAGPPRPVRHCSLLKCLETALDAFRVHAHDVPESAFLQALAEAFATRRWDTEEDVTVVVGPTGVEVRWPGSGLRSRTDFTLASVLSLLGVGQFQAIPLNTYAHAYRGLPAAPEVRVDPTQSGVVLPSSRPKPHTDTQDRLLTLVSDRGTVTRREVQDLLGLTQPTAVRALTALVTEGALEKLGAGPSTRYRLPRDIH